jgi:hypothetical protein
MKLFTLFLLITITGFAQFQKTDSLGNFYTIDHKLVWQKNYPLQDENELNQKLQSNPFTAGIDIQNHENSKIIRNYTISGDGLPEYARHDYSAFVVVDVFYDHYRISVSSINFSDYNESYYYNGIKTSTGRGTLDYYILKGDSIKRTTGAKNVLYSFDDAFSQIFDPMAYTSEE